MIARRGYKARAMAGPVLSLRARVCVIGAGLAGLATAIRLQSGGAEVTLIEARSKVGGAARGPERDPFRFDAGPLPDTVALADLWAASGGELADDLTLLPLAPAWRYAWPDGATLDHHADPAAMQREIGRFAPTDLGRFEALLDQANDTPTKPRSRGLAAWTDRLPGLFRRQGWRSAHSAVARFVESEKLSEALSVHFLIQRGGNPFAALAGGLDWLPHPARGEPLAVEGGTAALAEAMAKRFVAIGGDLRLGEAAIRIGALGNRISEVETINGEILRCDALASCVDPVHLFRDLLQDAPRGRDVVRRLARRRWTPGRFAVHFALEGAWPGIPHRSILFGPRYEGLMADLFDHGVLPRDLLIELHHPSITDASLAPPGKSVFTAQVPVPNLGQLPVDWEALGPELERRVLTEIGRRLVPDLDDRIVLKFHTTPRQAADSWSAHLGSAQGPLPGPVEDWLQSPGRAAKLTNLFLSGDNPRLTAKAMLESL